MNYFAAISATVVSSMRFEKPHSLSYHDETLTRRPETLVRVASKFDEWLASQREKGKMAMNPQPFPDAARFKPTRSYPIVQRPTLLT